MIVKLPKLEKLVSTNKSLENDHISKNIHVKNGYAFVTNQIVAAVDIRKYIESKVGVDEEDVRMLDRLLKFLEGNSFTPQYWSHLSKKIDLIIDEELDEIMINGIGLQIGLINNHMNKNVDGFLSMAQERFRKTNKPQSALSFRGEFISELHKAFSDELKSDHLKLDMAEEDQYIRFQFAASPYIFGYFLGNAEFAKQRIPNQYSMNFAKR